MTEQKIGGSFYPLTSDITAKLRKGKLTAAEWRIWSYLVEIDPWGDRYIKINTLEIMQKCSVSKATFYRAIAKFQELELFDFQDDGFNIRNLRGVSSLKNETRFSKMRQDSQICENSLKDETRFSKMRQDSQICASQPPEVFPSKDSVSSQTLQISSDFSHPTEVEEGVKIFFQNDLKEDLNQDFQKDFQKEAEKSSKAGQLNDSSKRLIIPAARENNSQIQVFAKKSTPAEIEWKWLPDGPWKNEEGKLDSAFQTALAQRWLKAHGGDIHGKKTNVLKHFRNEPTNLPIEWEWYQNTILHKAANIETRKLAGIDTTTDEQEILKHQRAGTELPQEMRVTQERSPEEVLQQTAPHTLRAIEPPRDEKFGQINPSSYQLKEFSADDRAFWQKIYSPQLNQATQSTDSSAEGEAEEAIDLVDDQKKAAKELISNLRRRHEEKRKRREENQEKGDKNLTPIGEIIYPPAETPFSVILEDMRKYLNCGSDAYRRIAIDWACDPINGCELVRARTGWIVDIRELDF